MRIISGKAWKPVLDGESGDNLYSLKGASKVLQYEEVRR